MEHIREGITHLKAHLQLNSHLYKQYSLETLQLGVGTVMVGVTLACLYLAYFITTLARLPPNSRKVIHNREYLEKESIVRFSVAATCIFTIDFLLLRFFDKGPEMMARGLMGAVVILLGKMLWDKVKPKKVIKYKQ